MTLHIINSGDNLPLLFPHQIEQASLEWLATDFRTAYISNSQDLSFLGIAMYIFRRQSTDDVYLYHANGSNLTVEERTRIAEALKPNETVIVQSAFHEVYPYATKPCKNLFLKNLLHSFDNVFPLIRLKDRVFYLKPNQIFYAMLAGVPDEYLKDFRNLWTISYREWMRLFYRMNVEENLLPLLGADDRLFCSRTVELARYGEYAIRV